MRIVTQPAELREMAKGWQKATQSIALVPTMGFYHKGHEALMEKGRQLADRLVVSLFVNPTQFGPDEDLAAYPRDFERDCAIAEARGADVLFAPAPENMYKDDYGTWVEVPELAKGMCGRSRPVHFRGVCTVVLKLLHLSLPDFAVFGAKDWQQQAIIRKMVRDLDLSVRIVTCDIEREEDGLAMSSRNVYLSETERRQAPHILQGLLLARRMAEAGETSVAKLRDAVLEYWAANIPRGRLDYLEVVNPESLEPCRDAADGALMACAMKLGKARLLDNMLLRP